MNSLWPAGPSIAVRSFGHVLTFDDLASDQLGLRAQAQRGGVVEIRTQDAAVVAGAIAALEGWASEVRLVPPGIEVLETLAELTVVSPEPHGARATTEKSPDSTRWILYTSGTTSEPKAISHTIESLTRTVATRSDAAYTWGLLYDPIRMAGLQVILQAMHSGAPVVAPSLNDPLANRVRTLAKEQVDALSATPSLWRQIMQLPISSSLALRQITLGGEIADQRILDALRARYPSARIVHVFASTETGAAFSVKDGRAGFPLSYLAEPPRGIPLEIRDDVLYVYSPGVSAAGSDGFASTGDIVKVVGDRVEFRGRSTGVVNIGGANVWPEVVETILRQHPHVLEAVVSSRPNAMTGNILVARVTLSDDADRHGLSKRLRSWVRQHAPSTHVPASVTVVDELHISATGKVKR